MLDKGALEQSNPNRETARSAPAEMRKELKPEKERGPAFDTDPISWLKVTPEKGEE